MDHRARRRQADLRADAVEHRRWRGFRGPRAPAVRRVRHAVRAQRPGRSSAANWCSSPRRASPGVSRSRTRPPGSAFPRPPIRSCWSANSRVAYRRADCVNSKTGSGRVQVSGQKKLERMRDGRVVYIGAERVDDVTAHPAFREGARTVAGLYDLKADPAKRDLFTFEEDGDRHALYWLRCRTRDDLLRRMRAMKAIADATYGFVGRSPDQVSGLVTGLAMNPGQSGKAAAGLRAEPAQLLRLRAQERSLSQLRRHAGERPQERRPVSRPAARRSQSAGRRRGRRRRHRRPA